MAAADVAKLAAIAVPLLSDSCPVCGQSIDPSHVEQELLAKAEGTETLLQLETVFAEAHTEWVKAAAAVRAAEDARAAGERNRRKAHEIELMRKTIAASVDALCDPDSIIYLEAGRLRDEAMRLRVASDAADYVRAARQPLYDLLDAFDRHVDQGALERAEAELASSSGEQHEFRKQLEAAAARVREMKQLANATVEARVEVTEKRLRSIQPLVADIYHRLDPHPAFKTVDFELNTYYRQGTTSPLVIDPVAEVSADPLLVFSTSQANIVALSYFLAMSLSMGEDGLPFLLLDDPVQSMDDVNVLGFADLCRHLREDRQLIVSTHERRLSGLLERKLAPRQETESTRIIRFTGWDRSGPAVDEKLIRGGVFEDPVVVLARAN
jgi:DNA repair exonuclease SbcCD ATPase subunit